MTRHSLRIRPSRRPLAFLRDIRTAWLWFSLAAAAGCAAEGGDAADGGGGGAPNDDPAPICDAACARAKTNESLLCKHGPWTYRRIRTGNLLEIDCSAQGSFDRREAGSYIQWFPTRTSSSTMIDLAKEPSEWPLAECFLTQSVYTQIGLNSDPTVTRIEATLSATETSARVASNNPSASPDFEFAADECMRSEW